MAFYMSLKLNSLKLKAFIFGLPGTKNKNSKLLKSPHSLLAKKPHKHCLAN
jgi:hypothetical protein